MPSRTPTLLWALMNEPRVTREYRQMLTRQMIVLERICALPEQIADRELTTNQDRARFIARDVRDYAEKAPAGLVIDSQTITKVLIRCRRNEATYPDCGPRHELPRETRQGRRRADETSWEETRCC